MSLLKEQPKKKTTISRELTSHKALTVGDGWRFGTGFGLAMLIAVPFLMIIFSCALYVMFATFGQALLGSM